MQWFNVEKVTPSKEPLSSKPVLIFDEFVMDEADRALYRMLDYDSFIEVYDRHNYFLARQYAHDRHTNTTFLYADYRLSFTGDALWVVNKLLKEPFKCTVTRSYTEKADEIYYECIADHSLYIQSFITRVNYPARWSVTIFIKQGAIDSLYYSFVLPFNCGPLWPAWKRVVECWVEELAKLKAKHIDDPLNINVIKSKLLRRKHLSFTIIPKYWIYHSNNKRVSA